MLSEQVPLSAITPDATTQARIETDAATVAAYSHDMIEGAEFPPVTLFRDVDGTIRVGDGAHRVEAARLAGLETIAAEVRAGSARDALMFSIQANARHGKQFTNEDKRRIVALMIEDDELSQLSNREIGRRCGVSNRMVDKLRAERFHVCESRGGNVSHSGPLSAAERAELRKAEAIIGKNLEAFCRFNVLLDELYNLLGAKGFENWLSEQDDRFQVAFERMNTMFSLLPDVPATDVAA
jgi:transposase-like protein